MNLGLFSSTAIPLVSRRKRRSMEERNGRCKLGFLANAEARMSEASGGRGEAMVPVDYSNGHERRGALFRWKVGHTVPGGRGGP